MRAQLARLMRAVRQRRADEGRGQGQPDSVQSVPGHALRALRTTTTSARFQKLLHDAGVLTTVRRTRGDDIDAACGQLKGQVMDRTRRQAEFRKRLAAQGVDDAAA